MASYIKGGMMSKLLLSDSYTENPLNRNSRYDALEGRAELLEEELYRLRTGPDGYAAPYSGIPLDRIRELRKELSKIGIEQHEIIKSLNPRWFEYWFSEDQ